MAQNINTVIFYLKKQEVHIWIMMTLVKVVIVSWTNDDGDHDDDDDDVDKFTSCVILS